jgi:hypothetical protein
MGCQKLRKLFPEGFEIDKFLKKGLLGHNRLVRFLRIQLVKNVVVNFLQKGHGG